MLTQQGIISYYRKYKNSFLDINYKTAQVMGFNPKEVALKVHNNFIPLHIAKTSMMMIKTVVPLQFKQIINSIVQNKMQVKLRIIVSLSSHFEKQHLLIPVNMEMSDDGNAPNNCFLLNLQLTQRAPDVFIEMVGPLLDIHDSLSQKKTQAIKVNEMFLRRMNLLQTTVDPIIDGKPYSGIIESISYSSLYCIIDKPSGDTAFENSPVRFNLAIGDDDLEFNGKIMISKEFVNQGKKCLLFGMALANPPIAYQIALSKATINHNAE